MNERIRQLINEATSFKEGDTEGKYDIEVFDQEKFAELIVRECGKVVVNGGYRNPALGEKHPLTPPEIARMIKEHFGVEL